MWQRFTGSARRIIFFAQEEAGRLGDNYVSTEHLLLGIVRENDSLAAVILDRLGVSLGRVRSEIERQVSRGEGRTAADMQLTPRAKRVIDLAYDEARQLNNNYIGTEHLLLGLIREGEGLAGRVLNKLGVDLERTRNEITQLQDAQPSGTEPSAVGEMLDETKAQFENLCAEAQRIRDRLNRKDARLAMPANSLGTVQAADGRTVAEAATDAEAFVQLAAIFAAKDTHGYRAMADGDQTMFLLPNAAPLKALIPPTGSAAAQNEGMYVRVLAGEYVGYAGWIFKTAFALTGPDTAPFPPA